MVAVSYRYIGSINKHIYIYILIKQQVRGIEWISRCATTLVTFTDIDFHEQHLEFNERF